MKIDKAILAAKLVKLKSVVPSKISIEALQGVLFENNCLMANNLDVGMIAKLDTNTDESFILPQKVIDLIVKLPDGEIEIKADDKNTLTIKSVVSKSKYQSFNPKEFVRVETIEKGEKITIDGKSLSKAFKNVLYAVADQDVRTIVTGVNIASDGEILDVVGTDGYRVTWSKIKYEGNLNFIVPKTAVQKLLSLGLSDELEICHNDNHAVFISEEYTVTTRLFDGKYINYKQAFSNNNNSTTINRALFANAIERLMITTDTADKRPTELDFKDRKLTISTKSSISEYAETIELEEDVEPLVTYINPKYLLESLKSMDDEFVELKLAGPTRALIFESEDTMLTGAILPIRKPSN